MTLQLAAPLPAQVGYIRLGLLLVPNSGKPEFGLGEINRDCLNVSETRYNTRRPETSAAGRRCMAHQGVVVSALLPDSCFCCDCLNVIGRLSKRPTGTVGAAPIRRLVVRAAPASADCAALGSGCGGMSCDLVAASFLLSVA